MALILDGTTGISADSGTELFPDGEIGIDKLTTTGTASVSTFLRGDAAWATVPDPVPSGTAMMFVQTAAPTGWTKSTTHDNKALRVVSGTASSGGSVAFTTAFASQSVSGTIANTTAGGSVSVSGSVGSTTLTTTQIPSHSHLGGARRIWDAASGEYGSTGDVGNVGFPLARYTPGSANYRLDYTSSTGSSGSHNHSFSGSGSFSGTAHNHSFTGTAINLAVQYVDINIATKD